MSHLPGAEVGGRTAGNTDKMIPLLHHGEIDVDLGKRRYGTIASKYVYKSTRDAPSFWKLLSWS
jgi:hypothetical protein